MLNEFTKTKLGAFLLLAPAVNCVGKLLEKCKMIYLKVFDLESTDGIISEK